MSDLKTTRKQKPVPPTTIMTAAMFFLFNSAVVFRKGSSANFDQLVHTKRKHDDKKLCKTKTDRDQKGAVR